MCVCVCVYTDYRYVLFGSTSLTETIYYKKREIVNQNVYVCVRTHVESHIKSRLREKA